MLFVAAMSPCIRATEYFASPAGQAAGTGTQSSPWDLATALNARSAIKPGDTLWLRGGTYKGTYISTLAGSTTAPVIVRNYQKERVIIDGSLAGQKTKNVTV